MHTRGEDRKVQTTGVLGLSVPTPFPLPLPQGVTTMSGEDACMQVHSNSSAPRPQHTALTLQVSGHPL